MKNICLLLCLLFFAVSCKNKARKLVSYEEAFPPICYVDTISIANPILVEIYGSIYVTKAEHKSMSIEELMSNKNSFRLFDAPLEWKYELLDWKISMNRELKYYDQLCNLDIISRDIVYSPSDTMGNLRFYKFNYPPKTFLMLLVADNFIPHHKFDRERDEYMDDVIDSITYSSNYVPRIAPLFSKKDMKKMNDAFYELYREME